MTGGGLAAPQAGSSGSWLPLLLLYLEEVHGLCSPPFWSARSAQGCATPHLSPNPVCSVTPKSSPVPMRSLPLPGSWKPIRVVDAAHDWGPAVCGLLRLLWRLPLRRMLSGHSRAVAGLRASVLLWPSSSAW